jgi:nucleoside-diphosphate-sugar epimerase
VCPIPGDGKQRASVTNCEDVAAMMSSVVGQEDKAAGQVFNCGTDSMLTYEELCHAVAKVAGKTAKVCVCARALDHA